jgi:hypothetical protein
VRLPKDEEGSLLVNEEDKLRFAVARPGDHLFCPFQCELCHFRNIQGRSPNRGLGPLDDTELMKSLRRVNLDAFWSREPTTVAQNLGKVNRALQIAHEMGMTNPPMPKLGPWKLEDEFGAGAAAIMARHSMDPGITEDTVQFETVRKMKSAFVNLYQASVENASTAVIGGKMERSNWLWGYPYTMAGMTEPRQGCTTVWGTRLSKTMDSRGRQQWRCRAYWRRNGRHPGRALQKD